MQHKLILNIRKSNLYLVIAWYRRISKRSASVLGRDCLHGGDKAAQLQIWRNVV